MSATFEALRRRSLEWASAIASFRATKPPRWVVAVAALVFAALAVFAISDVRSRGLTIDLTPLAITALVLVPLTVLSNAWEFQLSASVSGSRVSTSGAISVAFLGSAANNLPLPGSALVRIGALKQAGVGVRRAGVVTAVTGLLWASVSALLAGVLGLAESRGTVPLLLVGAGGTLVTFAMLSRASRAGLRPVLLLGMVELCSSLLVALRFLLAGAALGVGASFGQSAALGLSVVVASAIGFVPAGLGVREATAAVMATAVAIDPSIAVALVLVDRVAALVAMATATVIVAAYRRIKMEPDADL